MRTIHWAKSSHTIASAFFFTWLAVIAVMPASVFALGAVTENARIDTGSAGLAARVAPGEIFPVALKLSNFGGGKRVDVTVSYEIIDGAGKVIYTAAETVAVETTVAFVKTIQIPFGTTPGRYIARSSVVYLGQTAPATSEFPFIVERRIFGLFQNDLLLYGGIMLLVSTTVGIVSHLWVRRRRSTRLMLVDYSDIPYDQRVFYELISDTIVGMRQRVGQSAMDIAKQIEGLTIDDKTGRVLKLTDKPSKIIAELVSGYEKILGKQVSFFFRRSYDK